MSRPLAVLIAAPDLLDGLGAQVADAEVLAFADADVLRALETISVRRPDRVLLEAGFASTSRGTALVNRLRADPALGRVAVEVVTPRASTALPAAAVPAAPATVQPLDQRGTRRAPRIRIRDGVEIVVDGSAVRLVDLSVVGAQVVSIGVLKPNQRVRVSLVDEFGSLRLAAVIAWARYELSATRQAGAQYRAGLDFLEGEPAAVSAFAERHRRSE